MKVKRDSSWIRNVSLWWGQDGAQLAEGHVYRSADLVVGRLTGFDYTGLECFPTFKKSETIKPGTSLVKIGFPFYHVQSSWNEETQCFEFERPMGWPLFPIEGIHTRTVDSGTSPDGLPLRFLETSSPGLIGQSGGPTLDKHGVVYAIQSRTAHLPLGFRPKVQEGRREIEEHQFLNVGVGVHVETLQAAFDRHGVSVRWVD